MDIQIRDINLHTDIQGVRETYRSDEHLGCDAVCLASGKSSLENGFFIQVATHGDDIENAIQIDTVLYSVIKT